jgi:HK97 family phage portal protein
VGALARVTEAVSRAFSPRAKQDAGGGYLVPTSGGFIPQSWPWNFWQLGYNPLGVGDSAIVHACVAAYAQTVAMCPGTHWRRTADNGRERIATSALSRILKCPNQSQSVSDFFLNLTTQLFDEGNAYALALRNNRFEVAELHLFSARTSRPRLAPNGDIFYSLSGNPIVESAISREALSAVPARDVLQIRLECKQHPLIGEPPLTSALMDVAASNAMIRQALAYTSNQGRPSGVIETDMQLSQEQLKELRAVWDEQTTGPNAGGTPILAKGLKWQPATTTSRDAQLAETLQIADQRIATAFRMPLSLLSLVSGQGPQGSTEGLMQFWIASGLGFALNHIEEAVGRFFGLSGLPDEYLELDTAALQRSNFKDRIAALAQGVQGGIYAPNEARALEDLPEADDGDEPRVQQQVVPLSFGAKPPAPAAPPPPPEPNGQAPTGSTGENAAARDTIERILAAADRYDRAA